MNALKSNGGGYRVERHEHHLVLFIDEQRWVLRDDDELQMMLEMYGLEPNAEELAFMRERYAVSDEELLARANAAPDNGGSMLIELSELITRRVARIRK